MSSNIVAQAPGFSNSFEPENEQGVIYLFATQAEAHGYTVKAIGTRFPDAIIRKDGINYATEFEFLASNFVIHKHDPSACDLIICWKNDWLDCPIPVLVLSHLTWEIESGGAIKNANNQIKYWQDRALKAENKIEQLKQKEQEDSEPDKIKMLAEAIILNTANNSVGKGRKILEAEAREKLILQCLKESPDSGPTKIMRYIGMDKVSLSTVKRDLQKLISEGRIEMKEGD